MGWVAAIAGASGLVGGYVLDALIADPAFDRVVALVRRPLDRKGAKLLQVVVDFDRLEESGAWGQVGPVDTLFCCLGSTIKAAGSRAAFRNVDYVYPIRFAEAGRRAGASQFLVISSVGAAPKSSSFYLRIKGEVERDLAGVGFESLSIFRPSLLLGNRHENRIGERLAQIVYPLLNPLLMGGLRRFRGIEAKTVGRAMVARGLVSEPGTRVLHYAEIGALGEGRFPA
jgi:uncharacterized protein YbjT (DUF2867 family)